MKKLFTILLLATASLSADRRAHSEYYFEVAGQGAQESAVYKKIGDRYRQVGTYFFSQQEGSQWVLFGGRIYPLMPLYNPEERLIQCYPEWINANV